MTPTTTTRGPDFPGVDEADDSLLRHVVATGSLWFVGAMIACVLPLAGLLAAGWRPSHLPAAAAVVWWCASALAAAGVVALALAGCPVIGGDPVASAGRKSVSIRAGVVLVLVGGAAALIAVLV